MKRPYPTTRALAEMIRSDDDLAVRYVVSELKRSGGNVRDTAKALGCSERALYNWRDSNARLTKLFEEFAMGRAAAGPNAARARKKGGK